MELKELAQRLLLFSEAHYQYQNIHVLDVTTMPIMALAFRAADLINQAARRNEI